MHSRTFACARRSVVLSIVVLACWACYGVSPAQATPSRYPTMAPLHDYLMDQSAEIALARSAAPASISGDASVMVLTAHGYKTAAKGNNGFVCVVERSWSAGTDDPGFWNPRIRAPICFNAAAAQSQIPILIKRTELILAAPSKSRLLRGIKAAFDAGQLSGPAPGAMCFMMSRQGYLGDRVKNWHSHLMFFVPLTDPPNWAASLPGSPVLKATDIPDHYALYLVPITRWSDGSPAPLL